MKGRPRAATRRARWVSIPEVTDIILRRTNGFAKKLAGRARRLQLRSVRKLIADAERRDEETYTKRLAGNLYLKFDAIEALLTDDAIKVERLERDISDWAAQTRHILQTQAGHTLQLRGHGARLGVLERKQLLTSNYLADLQSADGHD